MTLRTSNEQLTKAPDRGSEPSGARPPSAVARRSYDAVVVGAGPNGLAAGITLARQGRRVLILEAEPTVGGGARTAELTLPGFHHDICSAVHPLGIGSPFLRSLPLDRYGLEWIQPEIPLAHPFDDGTAAVLERSVEATAARLGADGSAYRRLIGPLVDKWSDLSADLLGPLHFPRHPLLFGRFGALAVLPATLYARTLFRTAEARGLFAGLSAHSMLPLDSPLTAAFGQVMSSSAHAVGWPIARGGSRSIANALAAYFRDLGGEIECNSRVESIDDLPATRATLLDVTPRQMLAIAGTSLPEAYRKQLQRYRYGSGAYKIDLALDGPVPWRAADCRRAATVHVGGTLEEIRAAEEMVGRGENPERPFVLVVQSSLFDPTRAPEGKHTVWAYCHVPNGSTVDMTGRIEMQIERFAPGFRDRILARSVMPPAAMQLHNANYIGGDINGGMQDVFQFFTRPTPRLDPYSTPNERLYFCSSSTPPGGGVHGMCGYWAAQSALQHVLKN